MVRRVFVEKRVGFDVEARALCQDLNQHLFSGKLKSLRILNRYDVLGLDEAEFERACEQVFSEPAADIIFSGDLIFNEPFFAVEYLPGQYDQRADSAAQCISLLTQKEAPDIRSAKVYAFAGLNQADLESVKAYIINPVDSRIADNKIPETTKIEVSTPNDIEKIEGFISLDEKGLAELHQSMGLAMSLEDLAFCQNYFAEQKRDPFITEIKVIDTYWSDHCRHTTFLTNIDSISIDEGALKATIEGALNEYLEARKNLYSGQSRPITLMDMGTIAAKQLKRQGIVKDLDESEEINACSIKVPVIIDGEKHDYLIMFKNETHNHPTEIEPFGGAATCLGGAIRDPLSGRSYVYQAMRVTGSGDPTNPHTLFGKLPQRKITVGAAAGYSSYGNQIGLATGKVNEVYHEGYVAKRMEIGAVIAAAPSENVVRKAPVAGDIILLLGGRTGRDGIGGATGSSKAHTVESIQICGAEVQKGNPLTERKLQRLYRNPSFSKKIKRCNDFGAGGVCVAIGELAPGLIINLDAVPKKYEGLDGTELAISESQERMAVVVAKEDVAAVMALASEENLEVTKVAEVTAQERLVMIWRSNKIVDVSREFLDTNGVEQHIDAKIALPEIEKAPFDKKTPFTLENALKAISALNACSQKGLSERFDSTVGAGTVLMPFGGKYQLSPNQAMAALVPVEKGECETATLMSYGFDPSLSSFSPFHSAMYAVVDSVAKLVATGAAYDSCRLTFQEYFEKLGKDSYRWGKPLAALLGAQKAQIELSTPAIGGKDSMSGSFGELDVPPTLVSFAVSAIDANKVTSNNFKKADSKVVLFISARNADYTPNFDTLRANFNKVTALINEGKALSACAISSALVTICQNCFGNGLGFEFKDDLDLFAPMYGSIAVEMACDEIPEGAILLGLTKALPEISANGISVSLCDLQASWENKLEKIFPVQSEQKGDNGDKPVYSIRSGKASEIKLAMPRVIIPVFPGTNCEYDSRRAFEKAGAKAEILVLKNLCASDIEQSVEALKKAIDNSQIIMLPGGFSAGDEPDGSGKFITATLRNPKLSQAITDLLEKRDGLMLGICNGFQALIKLGLVPYGRIVPMRDDSPTLTFNGIGRHASCIVRTRISSVKSPWMNNCNAGDIHNVAISHSEGRFVASAREMDELFANGQVATQYIGFDDKPSMDIAFNPNGSMCAIEGIFSPDGRIMGKMGHSERIGKHLYKNVDGAYNQMIFNSGVEYFL